MKKLITILTIGFLIVLGGCSKEETVVEPAEPEVVAVVNPLYLEPSFATQEQIKLFNELSDGVNAGTLSDEDEAKLVARNFGMQFFTLKDKESKENVGGMMYIPSSMYDDFNTYAQLYYYSNYNAIISEYSKDDLLNVVSIDAGVLTPGTFEYKDNSYPGYTVDLTLTYAESKVTDVKTTATVTVVQVSDVRDPAAKAAYIKECEEQGIEVDPNNEAMLVNTVYRVLAVS